MPGEAVALGAAAEMLPLGEVAARLTALAEAMDLTRQR
jgi:chemotaxis response regulator CheB